MRKTLLLILSAVELYGFSNRYLPAVDRTSAVAELGSGTVPRVEADHKVAPGNGLTQLTRSNFETVIQELYNSIRLDSYNLDYDVFRLAMIGYYSLENKGALHNKGMITIINFAHASTRKRFYTIDLVNKEVKYYTYVAHGRNTGEDLATSFSNIPHSNQSSLGFYVTGETYVGSKGFSLRLDGMEESFNDKIRSRAVVIHAADYATEGWIKRYGRLGRSQGCPALPPHLSKEIINTIKNGTPIFTYYPDEDYLNTSRYLQLEGLFKQLDKNPIDLVSLPIKPQS